MAANYTEHYQLNQWEPEDKVLRTDFNADNLKIDGALAAQAEEIAALAGGVAAKAEQSALVELTGRATPQVIKTVTQSADSTAFQVDLSDVDWSQWRTVYICLDVTGSGYYYSAYGGAHRTNESHQIPGRHCLVLWPMYQPSSSVGGIFVGYNVPVIVGPCIPYTQFTTYTAICSGDGYSIKKGSKITIWGER